MAAYVLGVVLNQIALHDNSSNLAWRNRPVRSCHLAHCMRKKKYALSSGAPAEGPAAAVRVRGLSFPPFAPGAVSRREKCVLKGLIEYRSVYTR